MKKSATTKLLLKSGTFLVRYGLVVVLLWIGMLKFTQYEAVGVRPLAENSPILSWAFAFLSTRTFSDLLGIIEISTGVLIALRPVAANLSFLGSLAGIITFVITLTFIVSTPGIIQKGMTFPFISGSPGQFLLKDIVLLGASIWTAGEALAASQNKELALMTKA